MFVAATQNISSVIETDIATSLLIISCYVSLRKLHINVLSNIRSNLPSDGYLSRNSSTHESRSVSLCEVEILNERWMRNYTAFNLTLDSLHNSDEAAYLCAIYRPPDQSSVPSSLATAERKRHCMTTGDYRGAGIQRPAFTMTYVACALPERVRKETMSVLNDIVDQEHELHRIVAAVRGTSSRRIGFL